MSRFVSGFVLGLIILPLFGWLYFRFGYAPVATASSPMPFEKRLAHMALNARIRNEAPKNSPLQASDENYLAGARIYRTNCAICHGLPGQAESPTSKGMFPRPPELFKGHGVTDDPAGETYWKASNGIRLTGMPAYTGSLSQTEMWQVSLLLANADKLPQQTHALLAQPLGVN
jgi:mono/diheme cytochrome c family protein